MSPIVWLAIPLLVLVVAAAAVSWRGRPRRQAQMHASVRSFHRFRAAFTDEENERRSRST